MLIQYLGNEKTDNFGNFIRKEESNDTKYKCKIIFQNKTKRKQNNLYKQKLIVQGHACKNVLQYFFCLSTPCKHFHKNQMLTFLK